MRTILKYFGNYRLQSILSPFFKLCEAIFELIVPLVIADIIDIGIAGNDKSYILGKVILLGVFALVGYVCALCAQYFAAYSAAGISADLRKDLFYKIQHMSLKNSEKVGTSNLITALTSDVNQIQSGINLTLRLLLRSPFIVFGAIIMAMTVSVRLSLIFLIVVSLLGIVVAFNMRKAIPAYRATRTNLDELVDKADNGLSGVRVIRSYNRSEDDLHGFTDSSSKLRQSQVKAAFISSLLNPVTFLLINIAICLLIYRGAINVSVGSLSQGHVIALYNYMSQILVELIKLANLIVTVSRAIACAGRVERIYNTVDESSSNSIKVAEPTAAHSIEFKNVSFTFEGNSESTLSNVSFCIKAGERIGIIGNTGSGKSTIAQLAAGLYPVTSGQVLFDGNDINEISSNDLANSIGLCLQKARMFTGSIRYNISLNRPEIDSERLNYAIDMSCSREIVESKKNGIKYRIQANGSGLSGGQRQRIGIARVLAGRPGVLILDDSTSALDSATERKFLSNITKLQNNPTTIIISQKIKSVIHSDRILVINDGQIEAFGTHDELMNSSDSYRKLYDLQSEEQ